MRGGSLLLMEDFCEKHIPSACERNSVQLVLQGESNNVLGRVAVLGAGTEPEWEALPDALGVAEGKHLEDPESDGREVDEAFVGFELSSDLAAILLPRAVQVLVAGSAPDLGHSLEPEGVAEAAEDLDQCFEGNLDLEAEAVSVEDRLGAERSVGGDKKALGAVGIQAQHEANE